MPLTEALHKTEKHSIIINVDYILAIALLFIGGYIAKHQLSKKIDNIWNNIKIHYNNDITMNKPQMWKLIFIWIKPGKTLGDLKITEETLGLWKDLKQNIILSRLSIFCMVLSAVLIIAYIFSILATR
ncbi:hypothetical protein NEOKW01_2013 [Nematocida sp. AWRm80]|nr:hypothetical protein NEOKW01_2013 [Nematocida sp. AWRm80]